MDSQGHLAQTGRRLRASKRETPPELLMKRSFASVLLALLLAAPADAALFSGHSVHRGEGPTVAGSGKVVSQARAVAAFDSIQVKSAIEVDISIGPAAAVVVEFDDNLQPAVLAEVHGRTLVLDSRSSWSADHDPHVHLAVPALIAVSSEGSDDVSISGLAGGDLALRLTGSGGIKASGRVAGLGLLLNGSGDMQLLELQAETAKVRLNGSGDVDLNVSRALEAAIYGTGDVRYRGEPKVTSQVYGTGSVDKE